MLINWECLEEMDKLIEQWVKVDAIITDPPYWTVKWLWWDIEKYKRLSNSTWDTKIPLKELLERCNKLLRMNWSLILFSQEPYTSEIITNAHWNIPFNYRLLWNKLHFANCLIAKKAPVNYFEDICVFTKEYDTEFTHSLREYSRSILEYIWKTMKEVNKDLWHRKSEHFFYWNTLQFWLCTEKTYNELIEIYSIDKIDWFKEYKELEDINKRFNKIFNLPEWRKFKSNILEYKKDYTWFHPTQKPVALMEDLIKTYTNEWETVLDFTMWSWSTLVAAKNTNRKAIWIELDKDYYEIAKKRLSDLTEQSKLC
jgi:site-specific DNA-methyltransferase (adenine-specific)